MANPHKTAYNVAEQAYNRQSERQRILGDGLRYNQLESTNDLAVYESDDTVYLGWSGTRTDRENRSDLLADLSILTETQDIDERFKAAQTTLQRIRYGNPKKKVVATGHSLGGALAQYAVKTFHRDENVNDITFNAALNPMKHQGTLPNKKGSKQFRVQGDLFSFVSPFRRLSASNISWVARNRNYNAHSLINFKDVV